MRLRPGVPVGLTCSLSRTGHATLISWIYSEPRAGQVGEGDAAAGVIKVVKLRLSLIRLRRPTVQGFRCSAESRLS